MKLKYLIIICLILLLPYLAFGINCDKDTNGMHDLDCGGTNYDASSASNLADYMASVMTSTGADSIAGNISAGALGASVVQAADIDYESDDFEASGTTLQLVSQIPHTDVAETLTTPWDLAGSNCEDCTGIPLDGDFGSAGIMYSTDGAGNYGIVSTIDLAMSGAGDNDFVKVAASTKKLTFQTAANAMTALGAASALADYESSTSWNRIDGSDLTTNTHIWWEKVAGRCYVNFYIDGDINRPSSTTAWIGFTLPATDCTNNSSTEFVGGSVAVSTNGTYSQYPGIISMGVSDNEVVVWKDPSIGGNTWADDDAVILRGAFNFNAE